jgi:hypothetical protein
MRFRGILFGGLLSLGLLGAATEGELGLEAVDRQDWYEAIHHLTLALDGEEMGEDELL